VSETPETPDARPLLRVVRGEPTDEELAALVAVVTARAVTSAPRAPVRSAWADPARHVRRPFSHGRDAWQLSQRLR
jgi:Acyl-CoA carboxylase epsilon subunit